MGPDWLSPPPGAGSAPSQQEQGAIYDLGLTLETLTPRLAQRYGIQSDRGVLISEVQPGSLAALNGLRPGDVIVSVQGKEVNSTREAENALSKDALKRGVRLAIQRKGAQFFLMLRVR